MPKFGMLKNGELITNEVKLEGYKLVVYADVPAFDQSSQYVSQSTIVEHFDRIEVNVEIKDLELDDIPIEKETVGEFVENPPWEDKRPANQEEVLKAQIKATNDYMDFLEEVIVEMATKLYE